MYDVQINTQNTALFYKCIEIEYFANVQLLLWPMFLSKHFGCRNLFPNILEKLHEIGHCNYSLSPFLLARIKVFRSSRLFYQNERSLRPSSIKRKLYCNRANEDRYFIMYNIIIQDLGEEISFIQFSR